MAETGPTLAKAIQALLSHPSLEELAALHERRLTPEEAERIGKHIQGCSDCSEQSMEVARLLGPEEIEKGKPPLDDAAVKAIWGNLADALGFRSQETEQEEREVAVPPVPPPATVPWFWQPRILQPLAAGLLAATVVSSGIWITTQREVDRLEGELSRLEDGEINVPIVVIDQTIRRGATPGKEPEPVEVPAGAVLVLTPLADPKDIAHEVRIFTAAGERVWSNRGLRPAKGDFHLRLPRGLAAGEIYRIQILPDGDQEFVLRIKAPRAD